MTPNHGQPPKDGLVRALAPGLEVRSGAEGSMPTLFGHMLRFDVWAEIHSLFEGDFLERIAPGAAKKTLRESRDQIRILYNHGHDPHVGEKPLAAPDLNEDSEGVRYEGELFDTSYNRDLVPALEAGQFGSSMRFSVTKETFDEEPEASDHNPGGVLPERTIKELRLYEGGPVTFPAYPEAEAGVRSLTDRFRTYSFEEMEELFERWAEREPERLPVEASAKRVISCLRDEGGEPSEALLAFAQDLDPEKATSDDSGSNTEKHSPGAEKASHSKASRQKKDQALYGVKAKQPAWRLPEE